MVAQKMQNHANKCAFGGQEKFSEHLTHAYSCANG